MTGSKCRGYSLAAIVGLCMVMLSACTSNTLSADYTKIGSQMERDSIVIPKEIIEKSAEKPEAIIVFYNDQILKIISYEGADLLFHIKEPGWYCFAILEANQI